MAAWGRRASAAVLFALALALPASSAGAGGGVEPVTETEATAIADREPKVVEARAEHPGLKPVATRDDGDFKLDYYAGSEDLVQVKVDEETGAVLESWSGHQVAWEMARGYPGAFGHRLNAPYVWLPLCALFLIGLVDWRRPWRIAHLDLLVLLSFGASHFFFNRGEIGLSVPLAYPPLLYLLGRMLWIGFRGRGEGLRPVWPAAWLAIAALFLIGFRGGLNVADSGVIDVGYAGVVGADRIADGEPVYGEAAFPDDVGSGDTYGPVNYYAYLPFEQALPWSGSWDELPAAHAAAIFFDLGTFLGLLLLGRRLRPGEEGLRLGAALGFGWAAYPYAAFVLEANANDSLVAMLLVATLLVLSRPLARGATTALAGLMKFSPLILVPLLATYRAAPPTGDGRGEIGDAASAGGAAGGEPRRAEAANAAEHGGAVRRDRTRGLLLFGLGLGVVTLVVMAQALIDPGLATFWDRTIVSQIDRDSPFSIWGQVPGLEPLRIAVMIGLAALALLVALRPRRKSIAQVAALAAALLIGTQLIAQHWFYLYLVWFAPLVLVALATVTPRPGPGPARSTPPGRSARPRPALPSPRRLLPRSRSESASG